MKRWRANLTMLSTTPVPGTLIWVKTWGHNTPPMRAHVQHVRYGEILYRFVKAERRRRQHQFIGISTGGRVRRRLEHREWVRADNGPACLAFLAKIALERS